MANIGFKFLIPAQIGFEAPETQMRGNGENYKL